MILFADSEGPDQTDAQSDQGIRCIHMPEDTFSHGPAHLYDGQVSTSLTLLYAF